MQKVYINIKRVRLDIKKKDRFVCVAEWRHPARYYAKFQNRALKLGYLQIDTSIRLLSNRLGSVTEGQSEEDSPGKGIWSIHVIRGKYWRREWGGR